MLIHFQQKRKCNSPLKLATRASSYAPVNVALEERRGSSGNLMVFVDSNLYLFYPGRDSRLRDELERYTNGVESSWVEIRMPGSATVIVDQSRGVVAASYKGVVAIGKESYRYDSFPLTVLTPSQRQE